MAEASQYRVAVFGACPDRTPETRARIIRAIEDALLPLQVEGIYVNTSYFQFHDGEVKVHGHPADV